MSPALTFWDNRTEAFSTFLWEGRLQWLQVIEKERAMDGTEESGAMAEA